MLGLNAIAITPEILRQVSDIDEFKGLWRGLERHTTALQLLGDVADYGAQFERVLGPLKEQPISSDIVRILHANEIKQTGMSDYKAVSSQLSISTEESVAGILETAAPDDVAPLMDKLCDWVNAELDKNELHPLLVIAVFTSVFLQISPFEEANLRVVRFLIVLMMIKAGYVYAPYASLAPIMMEHAGAVFKALRHNQTSLETGRPDWSAWLTCFLELLQVQKGELHTRLYSKESDLKNLPALSVRIMGLFKEHQRLQMKEIVKLTRGRRATIKLRLSELLEDGYLKRHGQGRGTWYALV